MKKNWLLYILISCCCCVTLNSTAQVAEIYDYELKSQPFSILQAGLNIQTTLSSSKVRSSFIALEYCPKRLDHFGVQINFFMPFLQEKGSLLKKGGCEFGIFNKHFFRSRLSNRKIKYFIGLELRKGFRKYAPAVANNMAYRESQEKTFKFMGLFGVQWIVKPFVFEIVLPFGIERVHYYSGYGGSTLDYDFIFIFTVKAGFKF